MSAVGTPSASSGQTGAATRGDVTNHGRRLTTETKAAFKTTEFVAYVAAVAGVLIAGLVTKAGHVAGSDALRADRVWLYVTILTVGYMVSRGLAKAGSRQPYDERS